MEEEKRVDFANESERKRYLLSENRNTQAANGEKFQKPVTPNKMRV